MKQTRIIRSSDLLPLVDINHHFKVSAGPGAGKTYWLVNHIRNVIRNSKNLDSASRIACITYTTVAAEEISKRLEFSNDIVEISTIHNFLYKNIVKPYLFFLEDNDEIFKCLYDLNGHVEHKPHYYGEVFKWLGSFMEEKDKKQIQKYNPIRRSDLLKYIETFDWEVDESTGKCFAKFKKKYPFNSFSKKGEYSKKFCDKAFEYKKLYWENGIIHHEDVLYFSYRIFYENPILSDFIAARYRYIFLDEFQDTNPIQTKIIKWLAASGSKIGVIGDSAQSIFQFQGAKREDFIEFNLGCNQRNFIMKGNRRSSQRIISLLNFLRNQDGVKQNQEGNDFIGEDIILLVSNSKKKIVDKFLKYKMPGDSYCILSSNKEDVIELRRCKEQSVDKWEKLKQIDFNKYTLLFSLFAAKEYVLQGKIDTAINQILSAIRSGHDRKLSLPFQGMSTVSHSTKRRMAILLLDYIVNKSDSYLKQNLLDFYKCLSELLRENFPGICLAKIRELQQMSKIQKYAIGTKIIELNRSFDSLESENNDRSITDVRTIHKAKGAEFDLILLHLGSSSKLNHILKPKINQKKDDHRKTYVALSRAKKRVFISVNSIIDGQLEDLKKLGIKTVNLDIIDILN